MTMEQSLIEQRYQRKKGQPLCYEPNKDGSFTRHKKHDIVEYGFRIICLNCGRVYWEYQAPKIKQKITIQHEKPRPEKSMIDRMNFVYSKSEMTLALARKLRVYIHTKDRILAQEIQAIEAIIGIDQSSNRANNENDSMPMTIVKGKKIKEKKDAKTGSHPIPKTGSKVEKKTVKKTEKVKPLVHTMKSKTCPKCKKNKPIEQFGKRVYKGHTYYQSRCIDCR